MQIPPLRLIGGMSSKQTVRALPVLFAMVFSIAATARMKLWAQPAWCAAHRAKRRKACGRLETRELYSAANVALKSSKTVPFMDTNGTVGFSGSWLELCRLSDPP